MYGRTGTWSSGMFVPHDASHYEAVTGHMVDWDGLYIAPCPHGQVAEWRAVFGRAPFPMCTCRR